MTSSDGGGDDINSYMMMMQRGAATPMPNIPIAGANSVTGSPYEYGYFQNFLPEPSTDGSPNKMATGLTPDMLVYKSPKGVTPPSNADMEVNRLRDALAQVQAEQAAAKTRFDQFQPGAFSLRTDNPFAGQLPTEVGGGG